MRWPSMGSVGMRGRSARTTVCLRISCSRGKALRYLFTEPARGYAWIRKPSATFGGRSALDIMLRGEITDLIDLRAYLDAERGAW